MASSERSAQTAITGRENIICPNHQKRLVSFVCKDCGGKLICPLCVTTDHKNHSLEKLANAILLAKTKLQNYISEMEHVSIRRLENEMKLLNEKFDDNKNHFKDVIKSIRERNSEAKENIDKLTNSHIELCLKIALENDKNLQKYKAVLQSRIDTLNSKLQELKDTLQKGADLEIYNFCSDIPVQSTHIQPPLTQTVTFQRASLSLERLEQLIGVLTVWGKNHDIKPRHKWKVVSNFYCIDSDLDDIFPSSDDSIFGQGCEEFFKVDRNGRIVETFGKGNTCINGCSMSPGTKDMWFYNTADCDIRKVTGQTSTVMFHCDTCINAICVSRDGTILLSLDGQLVRYSQCGHEIDRSKTANSEKKRNFYRVRECPLTENLAVCHTVRLDTGYERGISILDRMFNDLCTVSTFSGELQNRPFKPRLAQFDQEGNLLVLDCDITKIIKYNSIGEFIQTIDTGITSPLKSLCVQSNGEIWVISIYKEVEILSEQ